MLKNLEKKPQIGFFVLRGGRVVAVLLNAGAEEERDTKAIGR
jgi:hypothetical protein